MVVADHLSSAFMMEPFSSYSPAAAYTYQPPAPASYLSAHPSPAASSYHSMFSSGLVDPFTSGYYNTSSLYGENRKLVTIQVQVHSLIPKDLDLE